MLNNSALGNVSLDSSEVIIFTDGASRGNPGPSGVGIIIKQAGKVILSKGYKIKDCTNNVAEYLALLAAVYLLMIHVPEDSFNEIKICADSELLIKQMRGEYKIKNIRLAEIASAIRIKIQEIGKPYSFHHVRREFNSLADNMANIGVDQKVTAPSWLAKYFL